MYCDRRLGGQQIWYWDKPPDAHMRIPDNLLNCTCFLCVKNGDEVIPGGTAFFVTLPVPESNLFGFRYLVTAKHSVRSAYEKYGNLFARINTPNGSDLVELPKKWYCSLDEGVDVAVIPMRQEITVNTIVLSSAADDENIKLNDIGIGNEVLVIGLFRVHSGRTKNIPIVRQGIISAMPDEPLVDKDSGLPYTAYLAELQSIGGLSGSPVFVHIPKEQLLYHHKDAAFREKVIAHNEAGFLYLLGTVRSHFDDVKNIWPTEQPRDAGGRLHSGIATVTPIQEALKILLENEELKDIREKFMTERGISNAAVNDAEFASPPFTKEDFENALKRASRRVQSSQPDEGKSKT